MSESNDGSPKFYGKYRGVVTRNTDPQTNAGDPYGRIEVRVQDVNETNPIGWALPAVPYAGNGVGMYLIPPVGASVWVEFEHGDPEFPVWTGCFWLGADKLPGSPAGPDVKVLKTDTATITLDDTSGQSSIKIETGGLKIVMDSNGIKLSNGSQTIKLSSGSVSINGGALEVT